MFKFKSSVNFNLFVFIILTFNYNKLIFLFNIMRKIVSKNPFSRKINAEFEFISNNDIDIKIKKAHEGFLIHSKRRPQ